jgi:hypothetical protein
MATTTPKIFGQAKPAAVVRTVLMTVAAGATAQVNIIVSNHAAYIERFSIEIIPSGTSQDGSRFVASHTPIIANGIFSLAGINLNSGDTVVVSNSTGEMSFTATGLEFTQ